MVTESSDIPQDGSVLKEIETDSELQCILRCRVKDGCEKSVYNKRDRSCILLKEGDPSIRGSLQNDKKEEIVLRLSQSFESKG